MNLHEGLMSAVFERVIAVVPVHNGVQDTLALLQSIHCSETPDLKIIIVDDGSTDYSSTRISQHFHEVTILKGNGDLWWAGATNLGIREALAQGADYVLTMNNDNIVSKDFLWPLLEKVQKERRCIVTSKLLSCSESDYVCSFGGVIDWLKGEIRDRTSRRDLIDFSVSTIAQWVHASSTLYPAELFNKIGLFDANSYPQYHSDADFSLRAVQSGYTLWVEPRSVVYRKTSQSGGISLLDHGGLWENITSVRSLFQLKSNYQFYKTHCKIWPFYVFFIIRYVRFCYSWLKRRTISLLRCGRKA